MELTGDQRRALVDALVDAFPTRADLAQMVSFGLDINLDEVNGDGNLITAAFDLVRWAQAHGRLDELVAAALARNPGNPELATFAARIGMGERSAPPMPAGGTAGRPQEAGLGGLNARPAPGTAVEAPTPSGDDHWRGGGVQGEEPLGAPEDADGYRYDAYLSYVDRDPDATWVWETLVPKLEAARLRVAVSGVSAKPGVPTLIGIEDGIAQAKRTVAVLSDAYLADREAEFEGLVAQTLGVKGRGWSLIPVSFGVFDRRRLPTRLGMLTELELGGGRRGERDFGRLIAALREPAPQTG